MDWPTAQNLKDIYAKLQHTNVTIIERYINRSIRRIKSKLGPVYDVVPFVNPNVPPDLYEIACMLTYGWVAGVKVHTGSKKKSGDEVADEEFKRGMEWLEEIFGEVVTIVDDSGNVIVTLGGGLSPNLKRTVVPIFPMSNPENWAIRTTSNSNPSNFDVDD